MMDSITDTVDTAIVTITNTPSHGTGITMAKSSPESFGKRRVAALTVSLAICRPGACTVASGVVALSSSSSVTALR